MEVYLREGDEYIGPFGSRGDAERFLTLMQFSGTIIEGIEIVEIASDLQPNSAEDAVLRQCCDSAGAGSIRKQ